MTDAEDVSRTIHVRGQEVRVRSEMVAMEDGSLGATITVDLPPIWGPRNECKGDRR